MGDTFKNLRETVIAATQSISQLTGLGIVWKDREPEDNLGLPANISLHCNAYCSRVKDRSNRFEFCVRDDVTVLCERCMTQTLPFTKTCHAGVGERVIPIFENGHFFGNFFVGPMRLPHTHCPYDDLEEDFLKLPVWDDNLVNQVESILSPIAEHIGLAFTEPPLPLSSDTVDPRVGAGLQFMRQRLAEPVTAEMVAKHVHLSTSRFLHLFSDEAGQTFSEALTHIRLNHARRLLASTDLDITTIAVNCGYANQNYFASVFRRHAACTPSQYRKNQAVKLSP